MTLALCCGIVIFDDNSYALSSWGTISFCHPRAAYLLVILRHPKGVTRGSRMTIKLIYLTWIAGSKSGNDLHGRRAAS